MYNWSTLKKLIWLYAAKLKGGAQAIIETITGNLPLVLQNAIQHSIKSLTRYGLCTQDGTPTPSAPVDIMCNNGALKWDSVNQRVYADGTPEVLTVGGPNLLNSETNITGYYITASGGISAGSDAQYTDLIPVKAGEIYVCSFVSGRNSGNNRWHGYDANGGWVKQLANVSASGQQGAKLTMAATIDSGISYVRLSYGITDTEAMVEQKVFEQQTDVFYEAKLTYGDPSILNFGTPVQPPYNGGRKPGVVLEVVPGETYAVLHDVFGNGALVPNNRVNIGFYESTADVNDATKCLSHESGTIQFTVPNGAHYAVIEFEGSKPFTFSYVGIAKIVGYQPYVAPQTASVPTLLGVGDYKDEAELIAGIKTGKVRAYVIDGTENWTMSSSVSGVFLLYPADMKPCNPPIEGLSTHFKGTSASTASMPDLSIKNTYGSGGVAVLCVRYNAKTSVADFKADAAAAFASGNPWIALYPLATETTEQTTAQHLVTNEGTNIVDSVANVGPLEANVKYMAASAQDVLSTLLGMRVTPKDISTQDAEDMIDIITGEDNK